MQINDRELLARTLQAEAGNQGLPGMIAAGSVVMNRIGSGGYGGNLRDVILKPGQFSAWNSLTGYAGGEQGQDMTSMTPSAEAYKAADTLLAGGYEDPTGGATHYYNPAISQPKWGAGAGGSWTEIGDHLFGRADAGRNPNKGVAADAMRAIGRQPRGILAPQATAQTETENMIPQDTPRGLLGSLGIQKMEEGAEGETGQRFYQRDSFKDTAATLAQGFAALGGNQAVQKFASDVAGQRTEAKARNKTVEYLRANGRGDLADAVEGGAIGAREAAGVMLQQPKATGQVVSAEQLRQMFPGSEIAEGLYNLKPDGTVNKVGGGPQVVVEGQKGVDEFAKLDARTLADVSSAGMAAGRSLAQIDRLGALLEGVPTGASGALRVAAGNFGIQTEGLDDLQAAQALINTLVPQQRPPGSGPMSDADLELFKQSLPRIINSPNGNKIILDTMRGVAQYDAMGAEIVQRYRAGEITQSEAFSQLQSRPDPFAGLNLGPAQAQPNGGMSREDAITILGG